MTISPSKLAHISDIEQQIDLTTIERIRGSTPVNIRNFVQDIYYAVPLPT